MTTKKAIKIRRHKKVKLNIPYIAMAAMVFLALIFIVIFSVVLLTNKNKIKMSIDDSTQVVVEFGDTYSLPDVTAKGYGRLFDKNGEKLNVEKTGDVDFSKVGEYIVKYKTSFKNEKKEAVIKVLVRDTEPPYIELKSDPDSYTKPGAEYQEEGFTATDNYDGDITDRVVRSEFDGKVVYRVSDSSGNETVVTREIVYKDKQAPQINLKGKTIINLPKGTDYVESGYTATDDCDGDLTESVTVEGKVDTSKTGTYTIKYKVSDSSGNSAVAERTINVYSNSSSSSGDKRVYLTFDDGPCSNTERLLNILDKYNVKVTFFVTNQYPDYVNLIGEAHRRGHTIAMHSYSHKYSIYESESKYFDDLNKISALCESQTGVKPTILRFPGGSSNTISKKYSSGIMSRLAKEVQARNLVYYDWNVSSGDASGNISKEQVYQNVIKGISGKKVSVVLQHDIHSFSVDAVEDIIVWGLANGYTFLPLKEDSVTIHHNISN